jgi:type VI secretion system protein ImpB
MEARDQLRDLLSKADRSENLESLLEQILTKEEDLKTLSSQLGLEAETEKKEG